MDRKEINALLLTMKEHLRRNASPVDRKLKQVSMEKNVQKGCGVLCQYPNPYFM